MCHKKEKLYVSVGELHVQSRPICLCIDLLFETDVTEIASYFFLPYCDVHPSEIDN